MSSSSSSSSSMTIITLVKFSSIVCRIDAQISIFRCLTKATNSALSSSSSSEFPLSSLQTHTHTHYCYSIFSHARTRSDCSLTSAVPGSAEEKMLASLLLD
jgi:hypothetical protein